MIPEEDASCSTVLQFHQSELPRITFCFAYGSAVFKQLGNLWLVQCARDCVCVCVCVCVCACIRVCVQSACMSYHRFGILWNYGKYQALLILLVKS